VFQKVKRAAIRKPTSANKARVVTWKNRVATCNNFARQTANERRKNSERIFIRRWIVMRAPQTAITDWVK
jgi:hypothetical protein